MTSSRKKPGMAFWATVVVVAVLVVYPLSYGPWHYARCYFGVISAATRLTHRPFAPLAFAVDHVPPYIAEPYCEYCLWWVRLGISHWGDELDRH
jgi:hypothetical protein